jgi:hypothetical protein
LRTLWLVYNIKIAVNRLDVRLSRCLLLQFTIFVMIQEL